MQAVGARLGEFLQLSACIFADVDEGKDESTVHHAWSIADVPSVKQTFRLSEYITEEFTRAGRAGETVIVRDTSRDERTNAEAYARLELGSFVMVPFHRQGRWTANMTVMTREPRDWRADEIELLQEIVSRVFPRIEGARAEEALRESEERLRFALRAAGLGAFICHPAEDRGAPDARTREIFGLLPGGALNLAVVLADMLHPDDSAGLVEALTRAQDPRGDGGIGMEIRIRRPSDGEERWIAITAQAEFAGLPGDPARRAVRIPGVVADVTERRHREERQRFLLALGDAMRAQPGSQAKVEVATRLLGERLNTSRALFAEFDETNGTFGVYHEWLADGAEPFPAVVPQSDFNGPILQDLQDGGTLRVDDAGDPPFARPDLAALAAVGIKAALRSEE